MGLLTSIARVAGRRVIGRLFAQGYSASKALSYLKSTTGGYRRKVFLADWREITGAQKLKNVYKYIPRKYALSMNLMSPTNVKQHKNFRYIFETSTTDRETGKKQVGTISMISDRRLSIDEAEDLMNDRVQLMDAEYLSAKGVDVNNVKLAVVYRKNPLQ